MSDIRRRVPKQSEDSDELTSSRIQEIDTDEEEEDDDADKEEEDSKPSKQGLGILDIFRLLGGLLVLSCALSWFITGNSFLWGWSPWFTKPAAVYNKIKGPVVLTDEELLAYDGTDPKKPIYVGLNGKIYDVSAAKGTYGPGGSYSFFAGRDAARAFLTGCFRDDLTGDLRGVEEMFIPIYVEPSPKMTTGQIKLRDEQDRRNAKKQVADGIEGWAQVLRGDTGRPYFLAGTIKRDPDWPNNLPMPTLCEPAREGRPRKTEGVN